MKTILKDLIKKLRKNAKKNFSKDNKNSLEYSETIKNLCDFYEAHAFMSPEEFKNQN